MWNIMKKTWKWFQMLVVFVMCSLLLYWMFMHYFYARSACNENNMKLIANKLADQNISFHYSIKYCQFYKDFYSGGIYKLEELDAIKQTFESLSEHFKGDFEIKIYPLYLNISPRPELMIIKYKHKTQKLEIIQKGE